jgi:hypothetical protein
VGNKNRKATKDEMAHVRSVISDAFPELEPVFGSHGAYGGHRAPRDHTISFRLRDSRGKFHSNVVWLMPNSLDSLTADDIRSRVASSNGKQKRKRN